MPELFEFPKVDSILCRAVNCLAPCTGKCCLSCVFMSAVFSDCGRPAPQMRKLSLCWGNWVGGRTALFACAQWQLWNFPDQLLPSVPLSAVSLSFPHLLSRSLQAQIQGTALVGSQRGAHVKLPRVVVGMGDRARLTQDSVFFQTEGKQVVGPPHRPPRGCSSSAAWPTPAAATNLFVNPLR